MTAAAGDWLLIAALTALSALVALLLGLVLLRLLRDRSVVAHLLVVSGAALMTVTTAVLATTRAMFLSPHDARVVLVVLGLSAASAAAVASLLGRAVRRATRTLAAAAEQVGGPSFVPVPAVPTAELQVVGTSLAVAHDQVVRARAAAAATEESRRALVAGMSHDLRTPLGGMRAMIESLEDGVVADPDTVRRYHRQLGVEVERLTQMVSDLFELSRVEGPMSLTLARVAAGDLVDEALASAEPVARVKGVKLVGGAAAGLPVAVDSEEFGRAMRNLLLNAIRHTPADGTVAVTASARVGEDALVAFAVADSCGGIPEPDLPRVFEASFRGDSARTSEPGQGGGLGLAIARGIVEAHRGAIAVANADRGCRFEVLLPRAAD